MNNEKDFLELVKIAGTTPFPLRSIIALSKSIAGVLVEGGLDIKEFNEYLKLYVEKKGTLHNHDVVIRNTWIASGNELDVIGRTFGVKRFKSKRDGNTWTLVEADAGYRDRILKSIKDKK